MADRIKGLTVEIGGDTRKLDKALKETNQEVKETQKQLNQVNKLLKLDPGNTELLAQKQQLLANRVAQTTEKLKDLENIQKQLDAQGVDKLSAEYIKTSLAIEDAKIGLKEAQKEAEKFNLSLEKASGKLTTISNKAGVVAEKTKVLSAAAAGVVAGLGAMAAKAMTAADDLNTLAQQSGLTTEEIQKMQYASDIVDVSSEDIIGALKKMRKNMDSTSSDVQEAWQKLGISTKDANGQFRDSTEVFYQTLEALSRIPNETERDIVAMTLFGKNADQLAGIIDDGGAALRRLGDEAERNGKILSQESLDAANAVNDLVDQLKADVSQTILITGAKALEALTPLIEDIVAAISKILDIIGNMSPEMLKMVMIVGSLVAAISPVAGIIGQITRGIAGFLPYLPKLIPLISAVVAAAPWIALGAAIATVVVLIVKNWDYLMQKGKELVDWIKNKVIEPIKNAFENVRDAIVETWENIVDRVKTNVNLIIGYVNSAIEALNSLISKINDSALGKGLGINIGTVGTVPGLASGGVVQNGGMALVGERGAELLTVQNGAATVSPINNTTINNYGVGGTKTVEIPLVVNGRILARAIYDDLESEGIRRGSQLGAAL